MDNYTWLDQQKARLKVALLQIAEKFIEAIFDEIESAILGEVSYMVKCAMLRRDTIQTCRFAEQKEEEGQFDE